MKKQRYINMQTGEIITATSQFSAYIYFKRESKYMDFLLSPVDVKPFK